MHSFQTFNTSGTTKVLTDGCDVIKQKSALALTDNGE